MNDRDTAGCQQNSLSITEEKKKKKKKKSKKKKSKKHSEDSELESDSDGKTITTTIKANLHVDLLFIEKQMPIIYFLLFVVTLTNSKHICLLYFMPRFFPEAINVLIFRRRNKEEEKEKEE